MQSAEPAADDVWDQVLPHLDEAMGKLSESDRLILLLRFFQRKALKDVGLALGVSEDAARMRVNRALGKLHGSLVRKGLTVSAAILATEMVKKSVEATPLERARLVKKAALEAAKAASIPSLLTTYLLIMANVKTKIAIVIGLLLLAGGAGFFLANRTPDNQGVKPDQTEIALEAQAQDSAQEQEHAPVAVHRIKTSEAAQEFQTLDANLREALHQEPEISEGNIFSYAVAPAVRAFGDNMTAAIPILLEGIKDTNETVRINAALGIAYMQDTAKEAIPQLLDLAMAPNETADARRTALNALQYIAEHNPASTVANVSELVELLNDPNLILVQGSASVCGYSVVENRRAN